MNTLIETSPLKPLSLTDELKAWWQIWKTMYFHPSVEAYRPLLEDPFTGLRRAMTWSILASTIAWAPFLIPAIAVIFILWANFFNQNSHGVFSAFPMAAVTMFIPVMIVQSILGSLFHALYCHLAAKYLGGNGQYLHFWYLSTAYVLPLILVYMVAYIIPFASFIVMPIGWYGIVLQAIALKTVYGLSTPKTILVLSIPLGISIVLAIAFSILFMLGYFYVLSSSVMPGFLQDFSHLF